MVKAAHLDNNPLRFEKVTEPRRELKPEMAKGVGKI